MTRVRRPLVAAGLAAALLGAGAASASADSLPWPAPSPVDVSSNHGADPTAESITKDGSYTVGTTKIDRGLGFGGGTVYYPTNPQNGEKFAGVVTMPGFMEPGSVMNLYGTRLASHGFVVLVADPVTFMDQPSSRARQIDQAAQALAANEQVKNVLDSSKTAVIGHSMGGGGALEAGERGNYAAIVGLHPWDQNPSAMSSVTEPTLVVGGTFDNIAPMDQHAKPMYDAAGTQQKGLLVRQAGTHFAAITQDAAIQGRVLSFLKTYVDGDTRYRQLYCGKGDLAASFTSPACGG